MPLRPASDLDAMHRLGMTRWTYCGYQIGPDTDHPYGGWAFVHDQYDGAPNEPGGPPADPRCGHADTIADAVGQIDDLFAMHPEMHQLRPLLCHGADRR